MTGLWTLVLIWNLGSAAGQNVVINGFSSQEACMAASQEAVRQMVMVYRWSTPSYIICVEVK